MKILVVSPHDTDVRWVKNILFDQGVDKINACTNASDAIELLASGNYDLLLSEVYLPVLSGFDLKKLMDSFGYKIPVAFFSEKLSDVTIKEAKYAGVSFAYSLDELDEGVPLLINSLSVSA